MTIRSDHLTAAATDLDDAERFFGVLGPEQDGAVVVSGETMAAYMGIPGWEADHVTLVLRAAPVRQEVQLRRFHRPTVDPASTTSVSGPFPAAGHETRNEIMEFHDRRLVFLGGRGGVVVELAAGGSESREGTGVRYHGYMECIEEVAGVAELPTEHLEAELCSLAARVAAVTCEFLLAVAEYDRRRGWESWECRDMTAWLAWKCGTSPVTAREQVRVARALGEYPLVRQLFSQGQLTYSQVRAIVRAVTPETEQALVELAQVSTAAQLEVITRAFRRSRQAAVDTEQARHAARYLRLGWDDEGNLVGSFKLPAEAGAILAGAIEANTPRERAAEADADGARDGYGAARADTLVELVSAGAASDSEQTGDSDYLVTVIVDDATLRDDAGQGDLGECRIADGPGLAPETARRIACDAAVVTITEGEGGTILDLGRRSRRPNRALRRAVRRRDGHCQFPGCQSTRVQPHHLQHWTADGPTKLENLVALCPFHHHRVHEGGCRILIDADGCKHFYHPSGYELSAPTALGPARAPIDDPGVPPYASGWDGSHLDLPLTLDCLWQHLDSAESNGATPAHRSLS